MRRNLRLHGHAIAVIAILTALLTYPTVAYLFRFDVFWLPEGGNRDVLTNLWNSWYFGQILAGKADLFYTDHIFYPDGVSLVYSYLSIPYSLSMNLLGLLMPPDNAFCFTFLLIISTNALAGYVYLSWLFKDKWLALFGACVFGFCPQALGYTAWPAINWIAPAPIVFYFFHRGMREGRWRLIALAGICGGLTCVVIMYLYVCVAIALGLFVCAFAWQRWRERQFWRHIAVLVLAFSLASAWRVLPMLLDRAALDRAAESSTQEQNLMDVMSFLVNEQNPILRDLLYSPWQLPENKAIGGKSYLGFLPLALVAFGLATGGARRKMLPWLGLLLVFLMLRLESTLVINGAVFDNIKLPKHYLNQLLPFLFSAFTRPKFFMAGAWLPWAVLACFGLMSLRGKLPWLAKPAAILVMIAIVCLEFYIPVDRSEPPWGPEVTRQRTAFLGWLAETPGEVRLVNLPIGGNHIKVYSYYQSLSGFPISEGAISRTPDRAYDYIRGNTVLAAWMNFLPIHCETSDSEVYLGAVDALEADGFSHIVLHRDLFGASRIEDSFYGIQPSYHDPFVSIYRPDDLRQSCPEGKFARHIFAEAHAEAINDHPALGSPHGFVAVLPPTAEIGQHFFRHLRHNSYRHTAVAAIVSDASGQVQALGKNLDQLETSNALWLLRDQQEFQPLPDAANYAWLLERFKLCEKRSLDARWALDIYLKPAIPCAAMAASRVVKVRYDQGIGLNTAYYELDGDTLELYLAWAKRTRREYAFSIQLYADDGRKSLQYDQLIEPEPLSVYQIDAASLPPGDYSVQLIVYDYESQASLGGHNTATLESFERALELGRLEKG